MKININKKEPDLFASPLYEDTMITELVNGKPEFSVFRKSKKSDKLSELVCGNLKFNKNSGSAYYNKTKARFKPGLDEYLLLRLLMERPSERVSYEEIIKTVWKSENYKKNRSDIAFIIRNIKNKLGIETKDKKGNKNLFEAMNGYRIVC